MAPEKLGHFFWKFFLACLLIGMSHRVLIAEVIVIKTEAEQTKALDDNDKKNYFGEEPFGSSNTVFDIIHKYQWPTSTLFASTMELEEKKVLFAEAPDAEVKFIEKKVKEFYPAYKALSVPNSVYQLFVITYCFESDDPTVASLLGNELFDFFDNFATNENKDATVLDQNFLDNCKKVYDIKHIRQAHFLINCALGKEYLNQGKNLNIKKFAANLINRIVQGYEKNNAKLPDKVGAQSARFDFKYLAGELESEALKHGGTVDLLIDKELDANKKNQALLFRATKHFEASVKVKDKEKKLTILDSYLKYSTVVDLELNYSQGLIEPRALSYGPFPFTGCFFCIDDMPFYYALDYKKPQTHEHSSEKGDSEITQDSETKDEEEEKTYFYALSINKGQYLENACNDLFIIPPFSALTQLFGHTTMYHAMTKAAVPELTHMYTNVDGFEYVQDSSGILFIKRDPLEQASLLSSFISKNATFIKKPKGVTESIQIKQKEFCKNLGLASTFYKSVLLKAESTAKTTISSSDSEGMQPIAYLWERRARGQSPDSELMNKLFIKQTTKLEKSNKVPQKTEGVVRVMSYNVRSWTNGWDWDTFYVIRHEDIRICNPDIIIFQEALLPKDNNDQFTRELSEAGFPHQSYCAAVEDYSEYAHKPSRFGNLLVSRYPFKEATSTRLFKENFQDNPLIKRCYVRASIEVDKKHEIVVYGTHLDVDDNSGETRLKQAQELLQEVGNEAKNKQVLVAADFNETSESFYKNIMVAGKPLWKLITEALKAHFKHEPVFRVHEIFTSAGFKNCFSMCKLDHPNWTTWTGTAVDTIYVSPQWKWPVLNAFVYYTPNSDHLPICMDFKPE